VGGTHGNERAGIHLARYFEEHSSLSDRWKSLKVRGLIANVEAGKKNYRYVDEDLNRCFTLEKLSEPRSTYEAKRAKEISAILGPKGNSNVDFTFDLHNSVSNTGMMLCFHHTDLLAREVAAHLNRLDPKVRLVHWPKGDQPFLPTLAKSGMTVELGPVAHGTVHTPSMERVYNLVLSGLDYLERLSEEPKQEKMVHHVSIGERLTSIDFPRDQKTGDASAFLHKDIQGIYELQDGSFLVQGQPLFSNVDGSVAEKFDSRKYDIPKSLHNEKLYPVFINEAAYFEKGTALFLYQRVDQIKVSLLPLARKQSKM